MSPEQAAGELDRLGPRSDISSLGATLYCLLTGRAPLDDSDGDTEERLRRVRAGEIVPPRQVKREVPPALEAVCQKAMARLPEDRYDSAKALAEDVEHWLADEPVAAWREPWTIRARRWARRYRTPMAGGLVALVAGMIGLGAVVVVQARANGRLRAADVTTRQALAEARKAQAEAQATLEFFQDNVLVAARPKDQEGGLGIDATIRAAVDAAEPRIAESLVNQPTVEASIRNTLGETYFHLGDPEPAIRQHEKALALRRQILGPDHTATLQSMNNLAVAYWEASRLADALVLYERALQGRRAIRGADHPDTLESMNDLALVYRDVGRYTDALSLLEEALKGRRAKLGPDHPHTLTTIDNLALAYRDVGRFADALSLHEEALRLSRAKLGPAHPNTLANLNNLAVAYVVMGRFSDALPLLEEALKGQQVKLGLGHPETLASMGNLAVAYEYTSRHADTLPLLEEALELQRAKFGSDHLQTLWFMGHLAVANREVGRLSEALRLLEEAMKRSKANLGPDNSVTLGLMTNLAEVYWESGRFDDALVLHREALTVYKAKSGLDHAETLTVMNGLARAYLLGRPAEAEPLLREYLMIPEKKTPDAWQSFEARSLLGGSLLGQGKYADAQPLLLQGYEGMLARKGKIPAPSRKRIAEAGVRIIQLYEAWDRPDQASAWKAKLGLRDLPADVFARP